MILLSWGHVQGRPESWGWEKMLSAVAVGQWLSAPLCTFYSLPDYFTFTPPCLSRFIVPISVLLLFLLSKELPWESICRPLGPAQI